MNDSRAYWVFRKAGDDDIYYDRKSRTILRGIDRITGKEVYRLPTFDPRAPLKVYLDPSYYCNLKCRHCITNSSAQVDRTDELPTERILAVLDELGTIGVLELAVGGGEPLCCPDIYSILKHARAVGLNVVLGTNGILVTPYIAIRLADIGVSEIRVSFEGWQQVHDSVRGHGTYQQALDAVAILVRSGQTTIPRLTLCQGSELGLEQLFKDLALVGAKVIKVSVVKNAGRASLPENQDLIVYPTDIATVVQLRDMGKKHGIALKFPIYFPIVSEEADGGELRCSKRMNCGAGFETGYISPSGNVYPCSSMPQHTFGNLASMSFMETWTSNVATKYRRLALGCGSFQLCALQEECIVCRLD